MSERKYLTDRTIKALPPARPGERYEIYDTHLPGFGVRVYDDVDAARPGKAGYIAFVYFTRYIGVPSRRKLGVYPGTTLEAARSKAVEWSGMIKAGKDPAVVEAQRRQEEKRLADLATERGFATIAEAFITGKVSKERRGKEVEREIRREFIAAWGAKPISEITRSDVRAIIEKKAATAPHQARNLLGIVKRLFTWVVESERYGIEYSPCDRLRPTALGIDDKVPRQRALKDHELET
jgi:hypothetical protein